VAIALHVGTRPKPSGAAARTTASGLAASQAGLTRSYESTMNELAGATVMVLLDGT
jgi:hypothetical protein